MSLDLLLLFVGLLGEAVVVALLAYRRTWETLPWFFAFCVWALIGDIGETVVGHFFRSAYFNAFFIGEIIDASLQFCVLVELAWSVFRPFRASLPRFTVWFFAIVLAGAGAVIWPFANYSTLAHVSHQFRLLGQLQQTDSILRILFFLILAGCSQLLSISWRDREMQVATGLGFYSMTALGVTLLHAHQTGGPEYHRLDQLVVASYLCSLTYWVVCFAQKEVKRREFNPQMQGMLLAVAGAARNTRIAMTDHSSKPRNGGR